MLHEGIVFYLFNNILEAGRFNNRKANDEHIGPRVTAGTKCAILVRTFFYVRVIWINNSIQSLPAVSQSPRITAVPSTTAFAL